MNNNRAGRGVIALFLALAMAAAFPCCSMAADSTQKTSTYVQTQDSNTTWYTSAKSAEVYVLSTAAQLRGLAELVNGTAGGQSGSVDFAGKTIKLQQDIDLGSSQWTPAGTAVNNESGVFLKNESDDFAGTFDGCNHAISGLEIENSDATRGVALFGYIGETGTVKNLTVNGEVTGTYHTAGVAAVMAGIMDNVTSNVTIRASGNYLGGIAAEAIGEFEITDCSNAGTITNTSTEKSTGRAGGILGTADSSATGSILRCCNNAEIKGYQYVGGIIGGQFGNVEVSDCCNRADLEGVSFGKVYLGGIAGKCGGGTISNCYNRGNLFDSHWAAGHIRAFGGIAGCEEGRTGGTTAISHCYNTGTMDANTSNMVQGSNFIYETGNISGGNSPSSANSMKYESCYYLKDRILFADSALWSDVYKENNKAYDTEYVTVKTEEQMTNAAFASEIGGDFVSDSKDINDGYPVLYWENDSERPEGDKYGITSEVYGCSDVTVTVKESAKAGETVEVNVNDVPAGKVVSDVEAVDASGQEIRVTGSGTSWSFTMPARAVGVSVYVENASEEGEVYELSLASGLDAIWSCSFETGGEEATCAKAGQTVKVTMTRALEAYMTSLDGITSEVLDAEDVEKYSLSKDSYGNGVKGVYAFTMPSEDVTVTPLISYKSFTVYSQEGDNGTPEAVKTYSRKEMENLAAADMRVSGYQSDTEAFIGKADTAVSLKNLLKDALGTDYEKDFVAGTSFKVCGIDGMSLTFSYDKLYGSQRYYYPEIFNGSAEGRVPVDAMFTISSNMVSEGDDPDNVTCDTLNAYRFMYGQTETEFNNGQPSVEYKVTQYMPKACSSIVVITEESGGSGDSGSSGGTSSGDEAGGGDGGGSAEEEERAADQQAADAVTALITNLQQADEITLDDESSIAACREAYNKLTDAQKTLVSQSALDKLKAAEAEITELKKQAEDSAKEKAEETAAPARVTKITVKAGKKKATITWKAVSDADGYQIFRSLKKTKGYKRVKTVTAKGRKFTNRNLKSGRRYYYKVRAYRTVNGEKTFGSYSPIRSVKAK